MNEKCLFVLLLGFETGHSTLGALINEFGYDCSTKCVSMLNILVEAVVWCWLTFVCENERAPRRASALFVGNRD